MSNSTFEQLPVDIHFCVSMIVINACSGVLATALNLLIIMTFFKTPSLRTPSNVLILNLAITDFVVGALVQPAYCTVLFEKATRNSRVVLNHILSVLSPVSKMLFCASLLTVSAITADRFLALHLHLRYQVLVTTKRITMMVILIWTFSGLMTTGWTFLVIKKEYAHFASCVLFCTFMLLTNIALMLKISCVIRQHATQIRAQQQAMNAQPGAAVNIKRSVKIMYYILGIFFLCYFPFICFWIFCTFSQSWTMIAYVLVHTILFINSSINPIIYFWRLQDMRNAALQLLRSTICRNNNSNNYNNNDDNNNSNC